MLTHQRLRELLDYDPETGVFTWRVNRRGRFARVGAVAGTPRKDGRLQISVDGTIYDAGPLAFLWMTGRWPARLIDHKNGDPSDDRWRNLREATYSQNGANSFDRISEVPFKGVVIEKRTGRYCARIKVNYKMINLGTFETAADAHVAYIAAARKYFGAFARQ